VVVQLGHWGCEDVGSQHLWNFRELWAPSDVPSMLYGEHPRPLEQEDMQELIEGYVATALNAQEGGCDGVEFHAAHGYLGMQFLSPLFNRRTDEYGGTTENRCRFALQVATAIRERCGRDFPLGIRVCFDEMNPTGAGITAEEGERIVRVLAASGLYDYFNITGGAGYTAHNFIAPMTGELREQFVPYAERVKAIVDVPVFMAGSVTDIHHAAALVAAGKVDVVAMTRAHIADPELVSKARSGRIDEIRPCAAINQGCINRVFLGREMSCTQNPTVGREAEWGLGTLKQAETPGQIVVVGGGPAGMKAAEVAAARGHHVTLYEREDELGGQARLAAMLPTRSRWGTVIRTLERAMERGKVDVQLGVDATPEMIERCQPDAVVMATGSRFATSGWSVARGERAGIPGLDEVGPLTPGDVLRDPDACGDDVLIVEENSGYAPLGLAELLADRGRRVRLVSRSMFIGEKVFATLDLPHVYPRLMVEHELRQDVSGRVGDPSHPHPAGTAVVAFHGDQDQRLAVCSAPALAGFHAAYERFIDLDHPVEQVPSETNHRPAQLVQPRPRGLIAAQAEHALQTERADALLLVDHVPHRREPALKRRSRPGEDRAGGHRQTAQRRNPSDICHQSPPTVPQKRHTNPSRQRSRSRNRRARRVVREPAKQLMPVARVVTPRLRSHVSSATAPSYPPRGTEGDSPLPETRKALLRTTTRLSL